MSETEPSLEGLPNEVLVMVIRHLRDASLSALIQASHRFHTLEPELYLRNARRGNSTALQWAAAFGKVWTARKALVCGANPNALRKDFSQHHHPDEYRIGPSRSGTLTGVYCDSPLASAAANGNLEIASLLIEAGAVIASDSPRGFWSPPLFAAIDHAQLEMIKFLVTSGNIAINSITRVDAEDTLLNIAIEAENASDDESNVRVVRYLLAMMDNPNYFDDDSLPPLSTAIIHRKVKALEALLESPKINHNQVDSNGRTPLMLAIECKADEAIMELLLGSEKVDFNAANSRGTTPIHQAANLGREELVRRLLAMPNVDPNQADRQGMQPVACALKSGFASVVELLMASERVNIHGYSLFQIACVRKSAYVITELLERDAIDKTTTGSDGGSWLHEAALHDCPEAATALIYKHQNHVNKQKLDGATPLLCAVKSRRGTVVPVLLQAGADVNIADVRGSTPLLAAAYFAKAFLSVELLKHGSNVDAVLESGDSALHLASNLGKVKLAHVLLKHGADPVLRNSAGSTPLHFAAHTSGAIVHELLKVIPHSHPVLNTDTTPLHSAVIAGNTAIAKVLVQHGADPMLRMANGIAPLEIACRLASAPHMVKMLLENGADPRQRNSQGVSYLRQSCARWGSTGIVRLLLEHGLDPNTVEFGTSALIEACRHSEPGAILALVDHGADVSFVSAVNGMTALHEVCQHVYPFGEATLTLLITTLVRESANVNARASDNRTPLHIASRGFFNLGAIRALLFVGAEPLAEYVEVETSHRITPIHLVSRHPDNEALRMLLEHVPSDLFREFFQSGWTPLHEAAAFCRPTTVYLLLRHGVNAMALADNGQTALHQVCAQVPVSIPLLQFEQPIDFEQLLPNGWFPLSSTAAMLSQVITLLMRTGKVDINHRDNEGRTALGLTGDLTNVPEIRELMAEYGAEL